MLKHRNHSIPLALVLALFDLGISVPGSLLPRTLRTGKVRKDLKARNDKLIQSELSKRFWRNYFNRLKISDSRLASAVWRDLFWHIRLHEGLVAEMYWNESGDDRTFTLVEPHVTSVGSFFEPGWYLSKTQNKTAVHKFHEALQVTIRGSKQRWEKQWLLNDGLYIPVHSWLGLRNRIEHTNT